MLEYEGFKIQKDEKWATMFRVAPSGRGGSIPTVLAGLYQSQQQAKDSIDSYRSQSKKKG